MIWVHTVCHRGFLNISADEKSRRILLQLAHKGLKLLIMEFFMLNTTPVLYVHVATEIVEDSSYPSNGK